MSSENVELVRRVFDAFNNDDMDAQLELWHEEGEFIPILARLEGHVYRGPEGVRRWIEQVERDWEVFEARPEEYRDLGDKVVALGSWRARGRVSGVELDSAQATWVVEVRDGKLWRWETFTDRDAAFRAAGLQPS
jgi:ketosteroid isomerase-like protein